MLQKLAEMEGKFENRFDCFNRKLEILDSIPGLTRRVEENEKGLEEVRSQLAELKQAAYEAMGAAS